jgi:hypothetical protein
MQRTDSIGPLRSKAQRLEMADYSRCFNSEGKSHTELNVASTQRRRRSAELRA